MSYYYGRRSYRNYSNPKSVKDETLPKRIDEVLSREVNQWESEFLGSLKESYAKHGGLTEKQHQTFQKVENRTCPKKIAAKAEWSASFSPDMRENMLIMARYYKANPPYFGDVAETVIADKEGAYVPSQKLYEKMCQNKYAIKVIATVKAKPLYEVGTMVKIRSNAPRWKNTECIVIDHDGPVVSAVKAGGRPITLLPVGSTELIRTEERYVKRVKK